MEMNNSKPGKIRRFIKLSYIRLVRINDTPQKIALGFGLGVFAGVMPMAGPVLAVFLAYLCRVNKASAFLGGLITNTWISILSLVLSVKIGAFIFGIEWAALYKSWSMLWKHFHWSNLFKMSVLEIVLPIIVGYIAIAFIAALIAYALALILINSIKSARKKRMLWRQAKRD